LDPARFSTAFADPPNARNWPARETIPSQAAHGLHQMTFAQRFTVLMALASHFRLDSGVDDPAARRVEGLRT
jgi:hypothetical protein